MHFLFFFLCYKTALFSLIFLRTDIPHPGDISIVSGAVTYEVRLPARRLNKTVLLVKWGLGSRENPDVKMRLRVPHITESSLKYPKNRIYFFFQIASHKQTRTGHISLIEPGTKDMHNSNQPKVPTVILCAIQQ